MSQSSAEQIRLMAESLSDRAKPQAVEMFEEQGEYDAFLTGVEWGARATIRYLAQAIFDQVTAE